MWTPVDIGRKVGVLHIDSCGYVKDTRITAYRFMWISEGGRSTAHRFMWIYEGQ
jgi:hypothetical protein